MTETTKKTRKQVQPQSPEITAIKRIESTFASLTPIQARRVLWFVQDQVNERAANWELNQTQSIAKFQPTQSPNA
jgi:hypothetical protein